jgi:nitrite reductase (NADH) small subunit
MNTQTLESPLECDNSTTKIRVTNDWIDVCDTSDIAPNTGVCAKVEQTQVAIFYLHPENEVRSLNNFDPIAKANILARGMLAEVQGKRVVASPLYKQHFCLQSGVCLQDKKHQVETYQTRIKDGKVQLLLNSQDLSDKQENQ